MKRARLCDSKVAILVPLSLREYRFFGHKSLLFLFQMSSNIFKNMSHMTVMNFIERLRIFLKLLYIIFRLMFFFSLNGLKNVSAGDERRINSIIINRR